MERFYIHKEASSENQLSDKQNIFSNKTFGAIFNNGTYLTFTHPHNLLEFSWLQNLVDTYNPDIVIGKESWLVEDTGKAEVLRADFTNFRRDRSARVGGVFICVKKIIASTDLWVDGDFEMIAVEVKEIDPKYMWEIVGIYRAANEDMFAIESLAARTLSTRNLTKRSVIGSDLKLPKADWKGDAEKASGLQTIANNLVLDNGYAQVVSGPARGDGLFDIYLLWPESLLNSCNILPGISEHNGVLLEVELDEFSREPKVENIVPL